MLNVALFVTCLTDQFYPHVGIAVTKILRKLGCSVSFPREQTCCGQPFFNNGYSEQARDLARRMVDVFEPYDYIVTPSGSCCAMVRQHFPELLKDDHAYQHGMHKVCSHTYEFIEFLAKVLKVDLSHVALKERRSITYHYTCHLRGIGAKDEAVTLLKQMGNVDFRPMERADQCCGFGGTFAVKYPVVSGAIVEDKVRSIAATEAQITVCNDAGCAMNISGMCHRKGVKTDVRHQAELIAEAMGIETDLL